MVFTSVNMLLHQGSNGFMDEVINNKFYNFGVQAYSALKAHKTIDIKLPNNDDYNGEEYIIPYHAVLEWQVTKEEGEYTKPEDEFCKTESEPTPAPIPISITLLDGTYEFTDAETSGVYRASLAKCYEPATVTVTVDGTTATLPRVVPQEMMYGEVDGEGDPAFTTYPAFIAIENSPDGEVLTVGVPTAGSHTVRVTVPMGSEVACDSE